MKKLFLGYLIRFLIGAIALGVGIWYVSSSLSGASLTYTSMDSFLNSIGAADGNVASTNGCFLCKYVNDLFVVLGTASEAFWNAILSNLWILMVIGFGIFIFIHSAKYIYKAMIETTKLDTKEQKLAFGPWFDDVWRNGLRIIIVGAIIGAFGMGGTASIRALSNITVQPVMYVGTELSMAATGLSSSTKCVPPEIGKDNPMASVSNSFMCIVGNINSVMLAGAAGGFALMNYAWMGLGGGAFTWIAGLLVVIMFVVIGFNLFFELLSVIFKLVFLVIFLPLIAAASAFEKTWKMASKAVGNAVKMLVDSAIKVIAISLKVVIIYSMSTFAADQFFPGPVDNYSAIFPPLLVGETMPTDAKALSIRNVFATCESVATVDGEIDKAKFKACFKQHEAAIEVRHPDAFKFMHDGWGFLMMMAGLVFIYFYVLGPRIDKIMVSVPSFDPFKNSGDKEGGGVDNFGTDLKKWTKMLWKKPQEFSDKLLKEK